MCYELCHSHDAMGIACFNLCNLRSGLCLTDSDLNTKKYRLFVTNISGIKFV
jgi:hypothetical protein